MTESEASAYSVSHVTINAIRIISGALDGLFDSSNSTVCGSRLIQLNDNIRDMVASNTTDTLMYHTSSFIATSAFATYNCYYSMSESLFGYIGFTDGMAWVGANRQYSWIEYIFLNGVWTGPENFEAYRQILKLLR